MDIVKFYEFEVLPKLDFTKVLPELNPADKGNYYVITCPQCQKPDAFIYKKSGLLVCNKKNNCGYTINISAYLNGGITPRGKEFVEFVKKLCEIYNLPLPVTTTKQESIKQDVITSPDKQKLLEDFLKIVVAYLDSPDGENARAYLLSRGWPQDSIPAEFGYYPAAEVINKKLQELGYSLELIKESGIYRTDWENRIVYPWRDRDGAIVNYWARTLDNSEEKKYLLMSSQTGATKAVPFGFNNVKDKEIIIVEGFFDTLRLAAYGIENVVALGGTTITREQLKTLRAAEISTATLLFDNDDAGKSSAFSEIDKLINIIPKVFIVPPAYFQKAKDPDDCITQYTQAALNWLISNRITAYEYKAQEIVRSYKTGEVLQEHELYAILQEAELFDRKITSSNTQQDLELFWKKIIYRAPEYKDKITEHYKRLKYTKTIELFSNELSRLCLSQNFNEIEQKIIEQARALEAKKYTSTASLEIDALVDEHDEQVVAPLRGKQYIGLPQFTLPELDEYLLGLNGLILLAAAPNVGKTALTVQNALDIVKYNPDACLLYVSLEMSRYQIISRMRCYLSGMTWKNFMFGTDPHKTSGDYFTQEEQERLTSSKEELKELGKRIRILDSKTCPVVSVNILLNHANELKTKTGCKRVMVVVDYLQVWPLPEDVGFKSSSDLETDKWRIGQMKKLCEELNGDPVMVISEARKPSSSSSSWGSGDLSDVMGSARTTYTPDIVIMLNPITDQELHEEWTKRKLYKFSDDKTENGARIREFFNMQQYSLTKLRIIKGRDGMKKGDILAKFYYMRNHFEQFNWEREIEELRQAGITI